MAPSFHKIFEGKKTLPEAFMRKCMVSGGAVAISEKLVKDHGWDREKLMAAPVMVVEAGVVVDSHWCLLGKLKDMVFSASSIWAGADKKLKVTVRLDDVSVFTFSSSNTTSNLSAWLDQEDLDMVTFTLVGQGGEPQVIDVNEAKQLGAGGCFVTFYNVTGFRSSISVAFEMLWASEFQCLLPLKYYRLQSFRMYSRIH